MLRFFPVLLLVCALLGLALGWNAAPHYRSPADSGEARLRERAAKYYQAGQVFDYLEMAKLYTPAKQVAEQQELLKDAKKFQASFRNFTESNQTSLKESAKSITPEALEVELEGDWAMTWGGFVYPTHNTEIPREHEMMVWVRSAGDWWVYTWTLPEIAAYGNPPDESYELLRKRKIDEARSKVREMQQERHRAEQQATPPSPEDNDATAGEDSAPGQTGDPTEDTE